MASGHGTVSYTHLEEQWEQHRQLLYITQHIHIERVSHCKAALLSKTDYDLSLIHI